MRAPLKSMLPFSRGVLIAICGDAAIAASRDSVARGAFGCVVVGCDSDGGCLLKQRLMALLFHLRVADEILPADDDNQAECNRDNSFLELLVRPDDLVKFFVVWDDLHGSSRQQEPSKKGHSA